MEYEFKDIIERRLESKEFPIYVDYFKMVKHY